MSSTTWEPQIRDAAGRVFGTIGGPTAEELAVLAAEDARRKAAALPAAMEAGEVYTLTGCANFEEMQQRGLFFLGFPQPCPQRLVRVTPTVAETLGALVGLSADRAGSWQPAPLQWERHLVDFWCERFFRCADAMRQPKRTK